MDDGYLLSPSSDSITAWVIIVFIAVVVMIIVVEEVVLAKEARS
jgi:hypothetical protein